MNPPLTPERRAHIMADAEAGAKAVHATLHHHDSEKKGWVLLGRKEVEVSLDARISRAREYAAWRCGAYERGECGSPW